jgi:Tol biopolymer transport system component
MRRTALAMARILAAVLALTTIGCAGSSSRPEEFTGAIAFVGNGQRLFTVDAADSTLTRIGRRDTSGTASWSPDGATVAYSTPKGEIVLADSSGGGERRLTRPWCFNPAYSPEGSRIVCDVTEPIVITIVNARNGSRVAETPDCCYRPTWSPDGRQIAYSSFGTYDPKRGYVGPSGVFVMNADATHRRLIARKSVDDNGTPPAWSSRGAIAFISDGAIWTVSVSGKGLHRLVPADGRGMRGLAWSPDGAKLAFGHGDGDYEVFVVNEDGSGVENLTDNEKIQDEWPSWSPDGRAIVFVSDRDDGVDQVFAMRVDGSGETQITNDRRWSACCASWSPSS